MIRSLLAMLLCFVASIGFAQNPAAPTGYAWSPNIGKPPALLPLTVNGYGTLAVGTYDVATVPYGDNWQCPAVGAFTSVTLTKPAEISVMPRFPATEPSAGFVILLRGPYNSGALEADRGAWRISGMPYGIDRGRASMPVYTHSGARYDRYGRNGYLWIPGGFFPVPDVSGTLAAWGPKKIGSEDRMPLTPCATGPDVTLLSSIPANATVWIAYAVVDMLGRETPISDPIQIVNPHAAPVFIHVRRAYDIKPGACGYRVYAGTTAEDLHRQPVLNYVGSPDKFLWPLHLQQFVLHDLRTDTPGPCPSETVSSLLNKPQQDVLEEKNTIKQLAKNYDLYCPFLLHYNPANFEREIIGKTTYTHKTTFNDQPLESDIPMLVVQNFRDHIHGMKFVSNAAYAGCVTNDYNGGQAFGNTLERCTFHLSALECVGVLIDERSSSTVGNHTASEMRFKECSISATIPVKTEGDQTAKIRFMENCEFSGGSHTRYPADTVGLVYAACSNHIFFNDVAGINGAYRSLVCSCAPLGQPNITVSDFFVDTGCPVYATFAGYPGGKVSFVRGERINARLPFARLVEAPVAIDATVVTNNVIMTGGMSSVSFMLNQLAIDSDRPFGEVVAPTEASWAAMGLPLEYASPGNPAYFDFRKKRGMRYTYGADVTGSVAP